MRIYARLLLATLAVKAVAAYVDEQNDAIVIEAARPSTRGGRQFWGMYPGFGGGMSMYPGIQYPGIQVAFGMPQQQVQRTPSPMGSYPSYPASTQPLSPLAQALCMLPTGGMGWCSRYVQPGAGKQGLGGYPGNYPGGLGGYPGGYPVGSYPGGYPGGSYPGFGFGGGLGGFQFPGNPGAGLPGAPGQGAPFPGAGTGFPVQGGNQPGAGTGQPGAGSPGSGGFDIQAVVAEEVEEEGDDDNQWASEEDQVIVVETEEEEIVVPPPSPQAPTCGRGKYFPIRYAANGSVAEEIERVKCDGDCKRIVNGFDADEGEWPWIAALLNNGRQFCGGSLIDNKHILTAAHCVASMSRYEVANLRIRLGDYKIKTNGETEIWESKAERVVRHKEFSQNTLHKDVAIITMEDEVPASLKHVSPVCLPDHHEQYTARTATVIGWGSLRENGAQPDTLQEMTVKIWDNKECSETYGNAAPGGIMDHMLCAGKQGKDSCSGDSGGPMQIGTGNVWSQIGIVSWGIGCGKSFYPGVYTRVTEVKDWIDRITKEY